MLREGGVTRCERVGDDCLVAAPRVVITHDSSSLGAFLLLAINFQQPLFPLFLFFLLEQAADSSPDRYLDLTPAYQVPSLLCFFFYLPLFFLRRLLAHYSSSRIVFFIYFFPCC